MYAVLRATDGHLFTLCYGRLMGVYIYSITGRVIDLYIRSIMRRLTCL